MAHYDVTAGTDTVSQAQFTEVYNHTQGSAYPFTQVLINSKESEIVVTGHLVGRPFRWNKRVRKKKWRVHS